MNEEKLGSLMERVNEIRLVSGAYEHLLVDENTPVRYRVAGGQVSDSNTLIRVSISRIYIQL